MQGWDLDQLRDFGVRVKDEVSGGEHASGVVTHDGFGLDVEIAQHFVGAPASNKPNDVCVNAGAQEGHSASGAEAACGDIRGKESEGRRAKDCHGGTKGGRDGGRGDRAPFVALESRAQIALNSECTVVPQRGRPADCWCEGCHSMEQIELPGIGGSGCGMSTQHDESQWGVGRCCSGDMLQQGIRPVTGIPVKRDIKIPHYLLVTAVAGVIPLISIVLSIIMVDGGRYSATPTSWQAAGWGVHRGCPRRGPFANGAAGRGTYVNRAVLRSARATERCRWRKG